MYGMYMSGSTRVLRTFISTPPATNVFTLSISPSPAATKMLVSSSSIDVSSSRKSKRPIVFELTKRVPRVGSKQSKIVRHCRLRITEK